MDEQYDAYSGAPRTAMPSRPGWGGPRGDGAPRPPVPSRYAAFDASPPMTSSSSSSSSSPSAPSLPLGPRASRPAPGGQAYFERLPPGVARELRGLHARLGTARARVAAEAHGWRGRLQERAFPADAADVRPDDAHATDARPADVRAAGRVEPVLPPLPWAGDGDPRQAGRARATRRLRDTRERMLLFSSLLVLGAMVISLLIPGLAFVGAMKDYNDLKAIGESGVRHLLAVKDDLSGLSSLAGKANAAPAATPAATSTATAAAGAVGASGGAGGLLDPRGLAAARRDLQAAQRDFAQLRDRLNHPDWVLATAQSLPGMEDKLRSVRALADVGYDVSSLGIELYDATLPIVTRLQGATLGDSDLLTPDDMSRLQQATDHAADLLTDVQAKLSGVSFSDLPLNAKQKAELAKVIVALPDIRAAVTQGAQLLSAASWLLGVGQARNFLVQTLDTAELRASGGFAGNYGVLTVANGKLAPFELYNVNDIDYGLRTNGWIFGRRPPAQYSWWPFANWGLRDSNLSPDFPTSARIITDVFKNEGGGGVDGVIQISPVVIQHILRVTGPIYVPVFDDTVTADNLVDKIHYYEEDPAGIAKQQRLFPDDHTHSLRKRFTQAVVRLVQDKVKHIPRGEMLPLARQMLKDLQAKDLQVYFANQQLETLLQQLQATGGIDTTPGVDGYYFTQTNVSVAKSTPYIAITQHDDVTLDDSGGARHHLVVTFNNTASGPYYGYTTLRDYVRFYVPPQAQLKSADGFDSGAPLCWAPYPGYPNKPARFAGVPDCGARPFPAGELACPRGAYGPGPQASSVFGSDGHTAWALDSAGGPTNTRSDVAGRAMWGGYVVVPRYCTARVTLDYYVPGVAAPPGQAPAHAGPYSLLLQRQGGTNYTVNVTIHPSPRMAASGMQTMTYAPTISDSMGITFGKKDPMPGATLLGLGSLASLLDILSST